MWHACLMVYITLKMFNSYHGGLHFLFLLLSDIIVCIGIAGCPAPLWSTSMRYRLWTAGWRLFHRNSRAATKDFDHKKLRDFTNRELLKINQVETATGLSIKSKSKWLQKNISNHYIQQQHKSRSFHNE